jgi:hypothetical protein
MSQDESDTTPPDFAGWPLEEVVCIAVVRPRCTLLGASEEGRKGTVGSLLPQREGRFQSGASCPLL